jgi:hypothetical protein
MTNFGKLGDPMSFLYIKLEFGPKGLRTKNPSMKMVIHYEGSFLLKMNL